MPSSDEPFELRGINHFALVCSDMERTVDFYTRVLGMPLVKTIELPDGMGQHFFFDTGTGRGPQLAFFWFPNAPAATPGIASAAALPGKGELASGIASMHHIAFDVPAEKLRPYRERLLANGVRCGPVINHDDSPQQFSREMHDGVHTQSVYFWDPDGILLELASWTRHFTEDDVTHVPAPTASVSVSGDAPFV